MDITNKNKRVKLMILIGTLIAVGIASTGSVLGYKHWKKRSSATQESVMNNNDEQVQNPPLVRDQDNVSGTATRYMHSNGSPATSHVSTGNPLITHELEASNKPTPMNQDDVDGSGPFIAEKNGSSGTEMSERLNSTETPVNKYLAGQSTTPVVNEVTTSVEDGANEQDQEKQRREEEENERIAQIKADFDESIRKQDDKILQYISEIEEGSYLYKLYNDAKLGICPLEIDIILAVNKTMENCPGFRVYYLAYKKSKDNYEMLSTESKGHKNASDRMILNKENWKTKRTNFKYEIENNYKVYIKKKTNEYIFYHNEIDRIKEIKQKIEEFTQKSGETYKAGIEKIESEQKALEEKHPRSISAKERYDYLSDIKTKLLMINEGSELLDQTIEQAHIDYIKAKQAAAGCIRFDIGFTNDKKNY